MFYETDNATRLRDSLNISVNVTEQRSQLDFVLFGIVVPVLFGLITLVGTLGNSLVIYVILSENRMRTVTNLLLLNLAFADLSFVLICPPFTAHQFATSVWPFGDVVCKLMHYLLNVTAYVTVYTLVLISAIRYMTIVHNPRTAALRTKPRVVLMICAIWVTMLVVNGPILRSYGVQVGELSGMLECENYGTMVARRIYATFFVFAYVLPLSIIGVLSVCILLHIQRQRPSALSKKTKSHRLKRQASRLIILVVVIFALLWLPVHLHLLIAYFGRLPDTDAYKVISVVWNCLAYFNSCVNPIIYNFASQEFRERFRKVVCCWRANDDGASRDDMTAETNVATRDCGIPLTTSLKYRENDE